MSYFVCNKCYYVEKTEVAPEKCIVCGADRDMFSKVNYSLKKYIPKYWEEHLCDKIQKIHENQVEAGNKGMSFALITDIHWGPNKKHSAHLLERVMDACAIPYVFNGGDTVSGAGLCPTSALFDELQNYSEMFKGLESRMLMAQGNHDPSYSLFEAPRYYVQNITHNEIHEYMFRYEMKYPDRVISDDGSYFYVDQSYYKMRLVVLNCFDVPSDETNEDGSAKYNKMGMVGFRQEQLDWIANTALNVPSKDWTVVFCSHINAAGGGIAYNGDVVLGLIDAFRNGQKFEASTKYEISGYNANVSADFTGRGGEFAVWVCGHTHYDNSVVKNSTLCTATISDWHHQSARLAFERREGTITEQAFDVFTIDPVKHKIKVTRVGAGEDREFDYTPRG